MCCSVACAGWGFTTEIGGTHSKIVVANCESADDAEPPKRE